ncbi:MAG: hypothetical protein ACHQUC_03275 [Chlamydiales bacterium]
MTEEIWSEIDALSEEIAAAQQKILLQCGRRLVPHLTDEDLLQPNDFPELENHPHFRYEEGILAGIYTLQMALRALKNKSLR